MRTPSSSEYCPLCDGMVDVTDMSSHLRALHQVAPGEPTVADVPAGRTNWRAVPHRVEREEFAAVGAA